jgi:putative ABC transport system substrate-binding protein
LIHVSRRHFIAALGAVLAGPKPLLAQSSKRFRIGVVDNTIPLANLSGPSPRDPNARALVQQLRELGWVDGKNIEILWRSAEEDYARRPQLLAELVRLPVDVILVWGNNAAREASQATRSIPIVMVNSADPIRFGLAASLARPGANVTGIDSVPDPGITGKRLALLKQAAPHVTKVAFPTANYDAANAAFGANTVEAAKALGITLVRMFFEGPESFEKSFGDATRNGVNGLHLGGYSALNADNSQPVIRALIERHRLPAIRTSSVYTESGAILNYGPDEQVTHRRAAFFVDRILHGAKAGELPIERPTNLMLIVNKRAAKAIGLTLPAALLAQADRVIE